ncbi:TetR/AcrR family transcriptional regulator [Paenibacillus wulumuqiensis]|uniref:TetR/AcrR family transcriptional regulator n=1 Tax=Paenibacillus wulumuqiensis TaxID=1567107 RepID=UPI000619F414|nr:TetR family transcriptional regulator [Paenibacillus wulumuqiensis]
MPTKTFFNLPDEKRQNLMNAAMREFSRASLADASIANIIKDACIPRGSFYQYFEDKADLFFYILEEHSASNRELMMAMAVKHKGDLFASSAEFFESTLHRFMHHEHRDFARNIFLNMNYKIEYKLILDVKNPTTSERIREFYRNYMSLINRTGLNIRDEKELFHLIKILRAIIIQNFIQFFAGEADYDEVLRNFALELDLLKRGLYAPAEDTPQ